MNDIKGNTDLHVPESLEDQLHGYRRAVWFLKLTEAVAIAVFSLVMAYLAVFALDRLGNTPALVRTAVFFTALVGCAVVPWYLHHWVWKRRKLKQLARLLSKKMPRIGDQLLGVIELAEDRSEQARSKTLVAAAINQVATDAQKRDFTTATPPSRRRLWSTAAATGIAGVVAIAALFPDAAANAWARLTQPWSETPRYTFAALEPLPENMIVAHGEPFEMDLKLKQKSRWQPDAAEARIGNQRPVTAQRSQQLYRLEMPAQIGEGNMNIFVGDAKHSVKIEPTLRPELTMLTATIHLPEYLGRSDPLEKDVRGGALSVVYGSRVALIATASRDLANAAIDDKSYTPQGATIRSEEELVEESAKHEISWTDHHGLSGVEPFKVSLSAIDDEAPTLVIENLPRQKVVLETELLKFQVRARDDYGVQRVGFQWTGFAQAVENPVKGERMLAAGDHQAERLSAQGVFSAKSLGIDPQPVELRVFAEDYFPDRGRVYSPPHLLYVLTPDQHAIWMTEQLNKWHRQALEVRDRELQLYETNRELRDMTAAELDQADTRRQVEKQAAAERTNGRRLRRLTAAGEELVREASRNSEIGVGHLERWAEMLGVLGEISENRMPSVADLLQKSSEAPKLAGKPNQGKTAPSAGMIRDTSSGGKATKMDPNDKPKPQVPSIADRESSHSAPETDLEPDDLLKKSSKGKLTLPTTTVMGKAPKKPKAEQTPAEEKLDEAITEQEDLLAEFEKIADELNEILANLEGSTLVKRLKAASRHQYKIGGRVGDQLTDAFGMSADALGGNRQSELKELTKEEEKGTLDVSFIMDDLDAYYQRRRMTRFKSVLDEMREDDVIGGLRRLGEDIQKKQGLAIAQTEFWSDSMDRWADDLIDPACSGQCPGGASPDSLPPSLVLEAMKILEAEINLREETRVAEQAKAAVEELVHAEEARRLSESQDDLNLRVIDLGDRIRELKDAEKHFGKELQILTAVSQVMDEAVDILSLPETGPPAIAAETEVIELVLRSKKMSPGGGGGGSSPGGGGGGDTDTPAIALLGRGQNNKEVREERDVSHATGESGESLPAEFRSGLDEYFSRLEKAEAE
ncbi:hypothetical protein [Adhaeretor mobilis]|uniref:DUF4175 family protein n=1 Tax=Adhaeretor mobilis TaxID=1930276 RepID=A0A517MXK9_9BACT|nr:hypothetical protein [Adhaeretor mobilis]QDS99622.1 hypothetical protein HG15A2_29480 [Adhaeretor mobilis]